MNRAESKKDFIHKIGIVEKEAFETMYWIELLQEANVLDEKQKGGLLPLATEACELLALFSSISRSARNS